ncbi:MAG: hypothetical protein WDA75_13210 [Candidatus Latescibacterota bacterium]|jgi:tetratricopeptide (TPR) repeat protein
MKLIGWWRRRPTIVEAPVADEPEAPEPSASEPFDAAAVLQELQACEELDGFLSLLEQHLEQLLEEGHREPVARVLRQVDAWVQRQSVRSAIVLARLGNAFQGLAQGRGGPDCRRALRLYEQALAEYRQGGELEGTAILMNNMGLAYAELASAEPELFRQAIPLLEEALEYYEQQTDAGRKAAICLTLGEAYAGLAEPGPDHLELARECYEKARSLSEAEGSAVEQAAAQRRLGEVQLELALFQGVEALDRAVQHFRNALALLPVETEPERRGLAHGHLARALAALAPHQDQGSRRLDEAIEERRTGLELLRRCGSRGLAAEACVDLAETHLSVDGEEPETHLSLALELAREARQAGRELHLAAVQARAAEVLGRIYLAAGAECERADVEQALTFFEEAARVYLRANLNTRYEEIQGRLREARALLS